MEDETEVDIVVELYSAMGAHWMGSGVLDALRAAARQLPDCHEKAQIIAHMERRDVAAIAWIPEVKRLLKAIMARNNH